MEADLVDHHHVAERLGAAVEHLAHVGHLHGIAGHPPRAAGFGAHRHDDVIGLTFLHQAGPHADAVLDDHAEAGALGELVADDVAELGSVGTLAARRTWPPACASFSHTVT